MSFATEILSKQRAPWSCALVIQLISLLVLASLTSPVRCAETSRQTAANVFVEIPFAAKREHDDPFNNVTLDVVFTDPQGHTFKVPAFWAGGNLWKVRYASPVVGTHSFRSECSDAKDDGLHAVTGEVKITPYKGENQLYTHGPVRVAADRRHLEYADGTPFFWLADTWWMGLCHRLHWPDEVKTLAADRKKKGFNVVQIVAGLYPDMHPFDPRGANEAGYPWEKDYTHIRPEYFDAADQRLEYLANEGFSPCIVGAWGYFMPWMGVEKAKLHWRYLLARYGAMPVIWCAAGEANLPWYLAKGFPYDDRKQVTEWTEVMRYIRATDPFHRPLTIHPTGIGRLSARHATDDPALLDIDLLQTPHGQRDAVEPTVRTVQESFADKPTMPVIDGEAAYEMLGDNLPTRWTRQMFWLCLTNGGAGHTYGANGIWQCNRPGEPHGPSPHHNGGVGYGAIPWNEAMNLPGSRQVGLGKKLFEKFEWQKFSPHPEWATYAAVDKEEQPEWGDWVWYPEGEPTNDAPAEKRYFRKTFELPDGKAARGSLWISADDRFAAYMNGELVSEHTGTGTFEKVDVSAKLKPGRNVLAVMAENLPAPTANPAGLLASLHVESAGASKSVIKTDASWRSANKAESEHHWTTIAFDDSKWVAAQDLGKYGCAPWGNFKSGSPQPYGPYTTGTANGVRIVYAPLTLPVQIQELANNDKYKVTAFDPTSGAMIQLGVVDASSTASHTLTKPEQITSDDWVIVLERK